MHIKTAVTAGSLKLIAGFKPKSDLAKGPIRQAF